MLNLHTLLLLASLVSLQSLPVLGVPVTDTSTNANTAQTASNTYDYIVVGSGPGGGPLASNLALAGASVLLLEAGDDQGADLNEEVAGWFFLAFNDPIMRWDFFVKYHDDDAITKQFTHLTWRTVDGGFYVGTEPPAGAEMLGVYYPRAGTLGGCSTHNALCAPLPSDSDWDFIADLTGDKSWSATNMRKYFIKLENDHSVPVGTPGHGFSGFLDVTVNDDTLLANQSSAQTVLKSVASHLNQDPSNLFSLIHQDLNNASPDRDQQTGIFGFPAHRDLLGRRVSARNAVVEAENKTSKLKLQLTSLVTKVLFDTTGSEPKAKGVEYLFGKSMYGADPRYNASVTGITKRAFARKEVILSGGAFNSPQLLKLSGIGPAAELEKFGIPVLVDLPGVGANLQDNNEFGVIATAAQDFTSTAPACSYGAPGDPCLAAWEVEGTGPYAQGPLDAILYKTANASERDIFAWGTASSYRGYWPSSTVNVVEPVDGPNTWGFAMVKMTPNATGKSAGTVMLRSKDPREVPDINFRFFENEPDNGLSELRAMADAVSFGRSVLADIPPPLGPFVESFPCVNGAGTCDVEEVIKTQTWSHHATSTCAIGRDGDKMAVLDSAFKVRGVDGLRVVDASVFPRVPGAFPVVPVFMASEKASEVIARAGGFGA